MDGGFREFGRMISLCDEVKLEDVRGEGRLSSSRRGTRVHSSGGVGSLSGYSWRM